MRIYKRVSGFRFFNNASNKMIATDIPEPEIEWLHVGKGIFVGVVQVMGQDYVIDKTTGAYVGEDIYEVQEDVLSCDDHEVLIRQQQQCIQECKSAEVVSIEQWNEL